MQDLVTGDKFWSVAQCYSLQEQRAVENLERQGFSAFSPSIIEHRPGKRSWKPETEIKRPTFPGYVFIQLEVDYPWASINSTIGVIRLLTGATTGDDEGKFLYRMPQRVPEDFIATLRSCLVEDRRGEQVLAPGTIVRARSGFLEGKDAVVRWSAGDRLRLLFQVFNREIEVEFSLVDVEVIEGV